MKNLNHTCNPEADKYCAEGADPNRHDLAFPADWIGQHPSHTGGCTCPIGENEKEPMTMTDFGYTHIKTVRPGAQPHTLRPAQVSIDNGDGRTEIYDLAGYGPGAVTDWREWAAAAFGLEPDTHIVGQFPTFAIS